MENDPLFNLKRFAQHAAVSFSNSSIRAAAPPSEESLEWIKTQQIDVAQTAQAYHERPEEKKHRQPDDLLASVKENFIDNTFIAQATYLLSTFTSVDPASVGSFLGLYTLAQPDEERVLHLGAVLSASVEMMKENPEKAAYVTQTLNAYALVFTDNRLQACQEHLSRTAYEWLPQDDASLFELASVLIDQHPYIDVRRKDMVARRNAGFNSARARGADPT